MTEEYVDNVVKEGGKQAMIGVAAMAIGTILTPVCPVAGPLIFNYGLGHSIGSTGFVGGTVIADKINK